MAHFKFEKLKVWNLAMDLGEDVHAIISKNFPDKERYNLSSQMMRAVDSIALNIAEGAIAQSGPEQKKFLAYAIRSLAETVTCLHKAKRRCYITEGLFDEVYERCYNLMNMTIAFRKKV